MKDGWGWEERMDMHVGEDVMDYVLGIRYDLWRDDVWCVMEMSMSMSIKAMMVKMMGK